MPEANKPNPVVMFLMLAVATGAVYMLSGKQQFKPSNGEAGQQPASAEKNIPNAPVTYDPAKCKQDAQGMVYFALGSTVFRMPYQQPLFIGGMGPKEEATLPKRPDPSELEGCPGNPIKGSSYTFAYRYEQLVKNKQNPNLSMSPDVLSIVYVPPEDRGYLGNQDTWENDFERVRQESKTCDELISGLIACRRPSADPAEQGGMEWSAYQAKAGVYDTPLGRRFTVSCMDVFPSGGQRQCKIAYIYAANIYIHYKFHRNNLPISEIINYDRSLRKKLEDMQVQNYAWPN